MPRNYLSLLPIRLNTLHVRQVLRLLRALGFDSPLLDPSHVLGVTRSALRKARLLRCELALILNLLAPHAVEHGLSHRLARRLLVAHLRRDGNRHPGSGGREHMPGSAHVPSA